MDWLYVNKILYEGLQIGKLQNKFYTSENVPVSGMTAQTEKV